jgi:hypothetical protein
MEARLRSPRVPLVWLRSWRIGRKGQARRVVIYGSQGETLREFDLPGDD